MFLGCAITGHKICCFFINEKIPYIDHKEEINGLWQACFLISTKRLPVAARVKSYHKGYTRISGKITIIKNNIPINLELPEFGLMIQLI